MHSGETIPLNVHRKSINLIYDKNTFLTLLNEQKIRVLEISSTWNIYKDFFM